MPKGVYERKIKVGRLKRVIAVGLKFAKLITIEETAHKGKYRMVLCRCDCGKEKAISWTHLKMGKIRSCGCLKKYSYKKTIHGEAKTGKESPEYLAYKNARKRCNNPKSTRFHYWGGRGIEFRFTDYDSFLKEVGRRPTPKHTLDRIDNNGHYEKGNVRWSTYKEQANNRRSNIVNN